MTETTEIETPLLAINGLSVEFATQSGATKVLENLNLRVEQRQVLGLVGESGSGKSVTALSVMRLLPSPPSLITAGEVLLNGRDLLTLSRSQMREVRGSEIAMIFQDPMTSLDPAFTIGHHLLEAQRNHLSTSRKDARSRAVELLEMVSIPGAASRIHAYPHELSGGMRQRVMIAIALACRPKLLIADEPTTALDVTVQAQILDLLRSLQQDLDMSILIVTHDLGVVAEICDDVAVMYAGEVVEHATINDVFDRPQHPYTEGLLKSMPTLNRRSPRLHAIPGTVPPMHEMPSGCRFHTRCMYARDACTKSPVPLLSVPGRGSVRCLRSAELELSGIEVVPQEEAEPTMTSGKGTGKA